jgi:hypothetical protein
LVSQIKGSTQTEGMPEEGAEKNTRKGEIIRGWKKNT